ncbi:hypothetical protein [Halolamina sp.]|uniref:hypothetical protein n=1 Tax=Halolamina sp. TaxID=1940283 RepID=UPI00356A7C9D
MATDDIVKIIDFRSISRAMGEIYAGFDSHADIGKIQQVIDDLDSDFNREDFKHWFSGLDSDVRKDIRNQLVRSKMKFVIDDDIGNKNKYISGVSPKSAGGIASQLSLNDVGYYSSFFKFADRTSSLHEISELNGVFRDIRDNAESTKEAEEIFISYVEEHDEVPELYALGAGDNVTPIIGDVGYSAQPRLVHFNDSNHLFIEYWKIGEEITRFDVNESDYRSIQTRSRTVARVHLDSNTIEYASNEDNDDLRSEILDEIVGLFAEDESNAIPDGGVQDLRMDLYDPINITDSDIEDVNKNIGVMSTLDTFHGVHTNTSIHSIDDKPTDRDRLHERLKKRGYIKSHPKLLLGVKDGQYELLDPERVDDFKFEDENSEDEEVPTIQELVKQVEENSDYDKVIKFTIVLNAEDDTLRIWKSALPTEVRKMVFHEIADELEW